MVNCSKFKFNDAYAWEWEWERERHWFICDKCIIIYLLAFNIPANIYNAHEYYKFVNSICIVGMLESEIASVNNKWQKNKKMLWNFRIKWLLFKFYGSEKWYSVQSIFTVNRPWKASSHWIITLCCVTMHHIWMLFFLPSHTARKNKNKKKKKKQFYWVESKEHVYLLLQYIPSLKTTMHEWNPWSVQFIKMHKMFAFGNV